ncbi:hypothetical protein ACFE04_006819 [Oxalis oulophora]
MQGHRGTVSSMQDKLNIDHGSSSTTTTNADVDQQIRWTNIHNRPEFPDCTILSPTNAANPVAHEPQNFNRWTRGEGSSSSGTKTEVNHEELRLERVWPLSGPRLDERRYAPNSILSLDTGNVNVSPPPFMLDSSFAAIPQNLNAVSASYVGPAGEGGSKNNDIVLPPPENDEVRRTFCKRKAIDGNVGPSSSVDGSSSYLQHPWPTIPARHGTGSSLNISGSSSEQVNSRLGLRVASSESNPDAVISANAQSSRRSNRMRLTLNQQESFPPLFSLGNAARNNNVPFDHNSLDVNITPPMVHNISTTQQNQQPAIVHPPVLPRNVAPFQWSGPGGSHSRNVESTGTRERSTARNVLEHPMFVSAGPELRNLVRTRASRNLAAANNNNTSIPARTGSDSGAHTVGWVSHPNSSSSSSSSSQHQRRISELVRRSLLSSNPPGNDSVAGGESSNHSAARQNTSVPPEEVVFPSSGSSQRRHHHVFPRSASWMERHRADGVLGIPQSLRNLAAGSEGRSRLVVSEIRNVLDLMRRGEGLRLEDMMVLDQSMYFGMADIHDRHRDMRLDVDNMSYEELLALEERIGNVNTGLTEENISNKLKKNKHCITKGAEQETEPCSVCQEEYNDGEDLGVLDCGHEFHSQCIKQWLTHKNTCPICKETGLKM